MSLVRWGWQTIAWATLLLGWSGWLLWPTPAFWPLLPVLLFCWGFTLAFFRDPRREPQGHAGMLTAPADGVVTDITRVEEAPFIGGPALRIGIFLSVFDVHVNRSPADGTVVWTDYRPGRFLDARHPEASSANECASIGLVVDEAVAPGLKLLVRQISGLIARRIVCPLAPGVHLRRGQLYGMIRFGSRTELWLPAGVAHRLLVSPGERVRCGQTPLLELVGPSGAKPNDE
jgi:phosphatidylserine decarboxylase